MTPPKRPRQAIITFDAERIAALDLQAEAHSLAWILKNGLLGRDYAAARGILSISLIEDGCTVEVTPPEE